MSVFTSGTHVDFVFSDINMPGSLNGLEFAGWLARQHPAVPILLTSGEPQPAEALGLGKKRHFMAKPYDLDEVDGWLRQMLLVV
jgi:DNA-binding NtrC family response regulator